MVCLIRKDVSANTGGEVPPNSARVNCVVCANYTILDNDCYNAIFVTTGCCNRTITLPTVLDNDGRNFLIKNLDSCSGNVIVIGECCELIDGAVSVTITCQFDTVSLTSDGSAWQVGAKLVPNTCTNTAINTISCAGYTILDCDCFSTIIVTTGASTRTVILPTVGDNSGREITVKKADSGIGFVTVDGEGCETIDGCVSIDLITKDNSLTVISNGSW